MSINNISLKNFDPRSSDRHNNMYALRRGHRIAAFANSCATFRIAPHRASVYARPRVVASCAGALPAKRGIAAIPPNSIRRIRSSVLLFTKPPKENGGGGGGGFFGGGGGGGWGGGGGDDDPGPLKRLASLYVGALTARPVLTKATSTLVLGIIGDYLAQRLSSYQRMDEVFALDLRRLLSVGAWGFVFMGPVLHYWYGCLDRIFFGPMAAWKKMATDQVAFAPFFNAAFILGVGTLEGDANVVANLKATYFSSMKANYAIWPIAQSINFGLVPKEFQILFVNTVGLVWNVILTYIAHGPQDLPQ